MSDSGDQVTRVTHDDLSDLTPIGKVKASTPTSEDGLTPIGKVSKPPADHGLTLGIQHDPVFGSVVAPALNFLDYPVRAGVAAIGSQWPGIDVPSTPEGRQKFWEQRDKILNALEIPETPTGKAVSGIVSLPGQLIGKAAGGISRLALGPKTTEAIAPYTTMAADVAPLAAGKLLSREAPEALPTKPTERLAEAGKRRAERKQQAAENKARQEISKEYEASSYEGGANALDMMDTLQKARAAGQPMVLADLSHALERLGGTVYRSGGAASTRIRDFLERRQSGASQRMGAAIDQVLTDTPLRDLMKLQADMRAARARPVWEEAMARGSTAPFESQYQNAWNEAGRERASAERDLAKAQSELTASRGKQTTAGNVYSTSAANRAGREASEKLVEAQAKVDEATEHQQQLADLLRKAQEDRTLDAPGATWSPGLQNLLDAFPEIRRFIANGIAIERRFAADDILTGKKFEPRDYAIVGTDAAGEPIIGTVPTMRSWHAAKVGIDHILSSDAARDPLSGRLNAMGASYAKLRQALLTELDRLNPKYKPARDLYAGDTAILRAARDGEKVFSNRFATPDDVNEYVGKLSDSERQAFVTGMAQALSDRLDKLVMSADRSQPFKTDFTRKRVRAVLGDAEADRFLDLVDREHAMKTAQSRVTAGSPTAERVGADLHRKLEGPSKLWDLADAIFHLRLPSAGRAALQIIKNQKRPQMVTDAMGNLLFDPNVAITPQGPLLPPVNAPVRWPPTAAQTYIGTALAQPQDTATLRQLLGYR